MQVEGILPTAIVGGGKLRVGRDRRYLARLHQSADGFVGAARKHVGEREYLLVADHSIGARNQRLPIVVGRHLEPQLAPENTALAVDLGIVLDDLEIGDQVARVPA